MSHTAGILFLLTDHHHTASRVHTCTHMRWHDKCNNHMPYGFSTYMPHTRQMSHHITQVHHCHLLHTAMLDTIGHIHSNTCSQPCPHALDCPSCVERFVLAAQEYYTPRLFFPPLLLLIISNSYLGKFLS